MRAIINKGRVLFLFLVVLSASCKKSAKNEDPVIGGDLAVRLLGEYVPNTVSLGKNNVATITFIGSNTTYNFDLDNINGNAYWGKLIQAQNSSTKVKIYVTKQTQIVKIE